MQSGYVVSFIKILFCKREKRGGKGERCYEACHYPGFEEGGFRVCEVRGQSPHGCRVSAVADPGVVRLVRSNPLSPNATPPVSSVM